MQYHTPIGKLLRDFGRPIGRSVIGDNDLEFSFRVVQADRVLDFLLEDFLFVVGRDDQRGFGQLRIVTRSRCCRGALSGEDRQSYRVASEMVGQSANRKPEENGSEHDPRYFPPKRLGATNSRIFENLLCFRLIWRES